VVNLSWLKKSGVARSWEVTEYRQWPEGFYFCLTIYVTDGSVLFIREYVSEKERMYSFHWQDSKGVLIRRWDNAPHYKNLSTFPHHVHSRTGVQESREIDFESVIKVVAEKVRHSGK
jgi:hypothetical protein